MIENLRIDLGHIAISQLILTDMSWNSACILNLMLQSQIWTYMSNIRSLWPHYDAIFKKSVKRSASSTEIYIFIDSVSQIIFFLVDISTIAYFSIICVKKANFLKDRWKMGLYLSKRQHYVDEIIRTKEKSISSNPTFSVERSICAKCFCHVWKESGKWWRSSTFLNIDCFQQFSMLNRAKMTSYTS